MKISKALKLKNKLAGEIAQAQKLINTYNVQEGPNKSPHDVLALFAEMCEKHGALAELKGKIAAANKPIWGKIFLLSELKARIAFLRGLSTKHGEFMVESRYGDNVAPRVYQATISAQYVETTIKEISEIIDGVQDQIDEFNAVTSI